MHHLARGLIAALLAVSMAGAAIAQDSGTTPGTTPGAKTGTSQPKASSKPVHPLLDACLKPGDTQSVVVACTTAIESRQLQGEALAAALFRRGLIQNQRAQVQAAVNDLSAALKLTPKAVDVLYARATLYAAMKRYDLAIADYDSLLKLVPGDPDSLYNRAWSKAALGRDAPAIEDLTALLAEAKGDIDALMDRGGLYLRLGKFTEAAADFGTIAKQDPKAAAAFYNRGRAMFLKGDFVAAAKDFQQAETLRADNPYARLRRYLATGFAPKGKMDAKILNDIIAKIAPEKWPMPVLATLVGKMPEKDLLSATEVSDKNVARRLDAEAHYYLGEAALLKKDQKAARDHFAAAAKGDRSLPEAVDAGWRLKQIQ
ncbi:MAG: tetratricopeptide repeat protein [Proteobacteria bacterium]|nr:tetratricopeptide repeat protein [Pseudomonadota bacterium]